MNTDTLQYAAENKTQKCLGVDRRHGTVLKLALKLAELDHASLQSQGFHSSPMGYSEPSPNIRHASELIRTSGGPHLDDQSDPHRHREYQRGRGISDMENDILRIK